MKKRISMFAALLIVILMTATVMFACSSNKTTSVQGKYYSYEDGVKDRDSYIELKSGKKWTDGEFSGEYTLKGSSISLFLDGEEMMSGTVENGVLTLDFWGMTTVYYKDGAYPTNSGNGSGGGSGSGSGGGNNGGNSSVEPVEPDEKARIESIVNGSVDGLDCYIDVSPSTTSIDLSGSIEVSKDSSWQLYADVLGQTLIPTKYAANLVDGENIYYVVVNSADGTVNRTYTLHIWRNFYVDVVFYSQGEVVKTLTRTTHTDISKDEFVEVSATGYTFTGWKTDWRVHTAGEDFYITGRDGYGTLTRTIAFEAQFSANKYTITLDDNDGTGSTGSVEVTYANYFKLPVPSRTGYTFDGWEYNGTKITTSSGSCIKGYAYDKDITAKAKWNANSYQLTVNNDDVDCGYVTSSGLREYNSSVTITATPNAGYTFAGWYEGGTKVSDRTSYTFTMPAKDVTYTAKWEINAEMQNFEFTSTTTTCTITGVKDTTLTSIIIPASVTAIGSSAFRNCSSLTSITIPDSVTSIYSSAFSDCTSLTSVTFGANSQLTTIGRDAFLRCTSLTSVTIPDSVTTIGYKAFDGCTGLTSVTIGDSVTTIGEYAFNGCTSLTSITIPDSVTSIGSNAFRNCDSLTSIIIPDSVTSIGSNAFSGCSSLESLTIPFVGAKAGVTSSSTYQYPLGYLFGRSSYTGGVATTQNYYGDSTSSTTSTTYYIPSSLKSVTVIGGNILYGAFYNCKNITNITLGDDVTTIGYQAFYNCNSLTSVTIGNSVTTIGSYAFSYCDSLTNITISASVTTIGSYAFAWCNSLTTVTFEENSQLTTIGDYAFRNCDGLTSIVIPDSVTSIGGTAFGGCDSLESITIPFVGAKAGVTGSDTYQYPFGYIFGMSSYTGGVATTQYYYGSSTSSTTSRTYYIPSSLKSVTVTGGYIPTGAFHNCNNITNITLGDDVTALGSYAFSGCTSLTSIVIPDSVTSIGWHAFEYCTSLTDVYYEGTEEEWNSIAIGSDNYPLTNATIHYNYVNE